MLPKGQSTYVEEDVNADLGVNVRTIQRLEQDAALLEVGKDKAPLRKPGSGRGLKGSSLCR